MTPLTTDSAHTPSAPDPSEEGSGADELMVCSHCGDAHPVEAAELADRDSRGELLMTDEEFEDAVGDALDLIPEALMNLMDNVVFFIEEESPEGEPEMLGVYDGTPLTDRDGSWGGELPDRITVFRGPTLRLCRDKQEVIDEVAVTVVHEIAHHFGIDDEKLHAWGWG